MDKKVDALVNKTGAQKAHTWAEVAANTASVHLLAVQWTAIRVHLLEAQGKTPPELLKVVKPVIQKACAVRQLWSEDIEVIMMDQNVKDRALNQTETARYMVLQ